MHANKISILYIFPTVEGYGADRSMIDNIIYLQENYIRPFIILPKKGRIIEFIKQNKIPYLICNFRGWVRTPKSKWWGGRVIKVSLKDLYNYISIFKINYRLRGVNFDIVHTNTITTDIGMKLAKTFRCKHIMHIREMAKEDFDMIFERGDLFSFDYMNNRSDYVVCNSKAVYSKYRHFIDNNKICVVYNGIFFRNYTNNNRYCSKNKIRLLLVGRLEEGKGQIKALQACKLLVDKGYTNFCLDLYGDGPLLDPIEDFISDNRLGGYVNVCGYDRDVFCKMYKYHIGLMCSKCEAFGRVTVEYMVNGLPVVGTDSGGTPGIIQEGKNGFLHDYNNVEELASKIECFLRQPDLVETFGKNAYQSVKDIYSIENSSEELLKIYKRVMRGSTI